MKTYSISSTDKRITKKAQSLWVLNEFHVKGIDSLEKFMEIVLKEFPELNSFEHTKKLMLFWQFRNWDYADILEKLVKEVKNA